MPAIRTKRKRRRYIADDKTQSKICTSDLILEVSLVTGFSQDIVRKVLDRLLQEIGTCLSEGHDVVVEGLGRWHLVYWQCPRIHYVQTKRVEESPRPRWVVRFNPARRFVARMNGLPGW